MISRQREAGTHSSRLGKKAGCYCDLFLSLTREGQSWDSLSSVLKRKNPMYMASKTCLGNYFFLSLSQLGFLRNTMNNYHNYLLLLRNTSSQKQSIQYCSALIQSDKNENCRLFTLMLFQTQLFQIFWWFRFLVRNRHNCISFFELKLTLWAAATRSFSWTWELNQSKMWMNHSDQFFVVVVAVFQTDSLKRSDSICSWFGHYGCVRSLQNAAFGGCIPR